jgi:hypothetical protein
MYYVIFVHPALSNLACQDWPPQKDFRTEFPALFDLFMCLVACPEVARLNGALNLGAHFPENGIMPDVGKNFPPSIPLILTHLTTYMNGRAKDVQRRGDLAR